MTDRRGLLLLPLLVAACGGQPEPVPLPPGPLSYKHLTPLPLNVASIEIGQEPPLAIPGDIGARLSPSAAEAIRVMARDRLLAVGTTGQANFSVTQAQLVQARDSLNCLLACRLEILSPLGTRLGFVEAQSRRAVSGPDANRPNAPEALLRRTMDDLNVEFEFQLRRTLRDWLSATAPNADGGLAAPPPAPVSQEDLPPGPGAEPASQPARRETLQP